MNARVFKYLVVFIFIFLIVGCTSPKEITQTPTLIPSPTAVITPSPTPTPTHTPTATPLPTLAPPPMPDPGTGNVYGRVLYQGKPTADFAISIFGTSSDISWVHEIETSDENGYFEFRNLPPGDDYTLVGLLEPKYWLPDFLEEGQVEVVEMVIKITADTNMNFGEYHFIPTDLVLISPEKAEKISESMPSLSWEPYPGAAYYHLYVAQAYGNYTDFELDTPETQFDIGLPLMACGYGWDVTAFDSSDSPLASSGRSFFSINNDLLPWCEITLLSPQNFAHIPAYGGKWEIAWDTHPLAVKYRVQITKSHDAYGNISLDWGIVDEVIEVQEDGSYTFPNFPALPRGQYWWQVWAYPEEGGVIAESKRYVFTIE